MNHLKQIFGNMRKKKKWGKPGEERAGLKYIEKDNISKNGKRGRMGREGEREVMIPTILLYYGKISIMFL